MINNVNSGETQKTGQPDNACQIGFGGMTPGFSYAEYNDLDSFKAAVTENTIGIMVEPVQGEGGVHPATKEFLVGLREFCDEKGILLLLDEVQTFPKFRRRHMHIFLMAKILIPSSECSRKSAL